MEKEKKNMEKNQRPDSPTWNILFLHKMKDILRLASDSNERPTYNSENWDSLRKMKWETKENQGEKKSDEMTR